MADYFKTGFERDALIVLGEIRDTLKEALEIQKQAWAKLNAPAINVQNSVHTESAQEYMDKAQDFQGKRLR